MKSLTSESIAVLNAIKNADFQSFFQKKQECNDIEHVSFVIKSAYMLPQVSCKLDFIKSDDVFFGVNKGSLLFEVAFKQNQNGFEVFDITTEGFNKIERCVQATNRA